MVICTEKDPILSVMAFPTGAESKVIAAVSAGPNPLPFTVRGEAGGPACIERVMLAEAAWTSTREKLSRPKLRTPTSSREQTTITLNREENGIKRTSLSKMCHRLILSER